MTDQQLIWRAKPARRAAALLNRLSRKIAGAVIGRHRLGKTSSIDSAARVDLDAALAALQVKRPPGPKKRVLVDGSWENPNYWYRYALLRAALGLASDGEVAFIGPYQRARASRTLTAFGVSRILDFESLRRRHPEARRLAVALLRSVRNPTDIVNWPLPSELPGAIVYDGILKRQRSGRVDIGDPLLIDYVAEAIESVLAAENLLDEARPDIVVLSHALEFRYGSIAWCALRRGLPVIIAFGNYGSPRYCLMLKSEDFFNSVDRPSPASLLALEPNAADRLAARGRDYLKRRFAGQTEDLGAQFAFTKSPRGGDRASICDEFGWDQRKPIVAVYASNWFDYPHTFGMRNFSDFLDWLKLTLDAAEQQTSCNWLFRAHPADAWYGGLTLSDLMTASPADHIRLCPIDWNGADVQRAADGLVTVHGTAGIEYAAAGKPVLVADRGWYHDMTFVTYADSREAYSGNLVDLSWLRRPSPDHARLAQIFAGTYFSLPRADSIAMGDDSDQNRLIPRLLELLQTNPGFIDSEIASIATWWLTQTPHFHSWRTLAEFTTAYAGVPSVIDEPTQR